MSQDPQPIPLKPCPFCGGRAVLYDLLDTHCFFTVECFDCDTDKTARTRDEVVQKWNTRAQEPQP